jgi:hypothetical protein
VNGWTALQWWRYCRDHPDLDFTCRALLGELVARHNATTGVARGGLGGLAATLGCDRGTVQRHLPHLRDGGHVVLARRHPHGARRADEYEIPWLDNDARGARTGPRVPGERSWARNAPTNASTSATTNAPTTTTTSGGGSESTTSSAPQSPNGVDVEAAGGGGDLIELSKKAAERLADVGSAIIRDRPAWTAKVSKRIATDATALLDAQPELAVAHAVAIASGESAPVVDAPARPTCERCGHHLDVPSSCALATYGECPHGRGAPS